MDTNNTVYLDYAATTPVDPRVITAMLPYFHDTFGNPSSVHVFGQRAEAALEAARDKTARVMNAKTTEIIFTANGTESDNLALRGIAFAEKRKRGANHILISPVEHHAVSATAHQLADEFGFELEFLPVDEYGRVNAENIKDRIRPETAVVSVIYANNEIGTINPVGEIGAVCRAAGVPFHSDAVQAAAHLPVDVHKDQVDLLAIGAHKFYGPKGVGALFVKNGTDLLPTLTGGKQENGLRAGTQNIPYIVGLAEALSLAAAERTQRNQQDSLLRDRIIGRVLEEIPDARLTGHPTMRLPNHASFVFAGADGNRLLMLLDVAGFACSSGSACKVGQPEPSEVLSAIGLNREWALGSLRVTVGSGTTLDQVDRFLDVLPGLVEKARRK